MQPNYQISILGVSNNLFYSGEEYNGVASLAAFLSLLEIFDESPKSVILAHFRSFVNSIC